MAANTFFRYDTWVSSATGPAIAGAQVYVCTQPANIDAAPPSPLAAIYSDSGGLVPITQPLITDGFGHADFYALPGLYTVVIALNGIIQSVFPDQSLGGVGTSGGGGGGQSGSILLQTNGVTNTNQFILNLESTDDSVTVTSDSDGNVNLEVQGLSSTVCPLPPLITSFVAGSYAGVTGWLYIPAWAVGASGSSMRITLAVDATSGQHVNIGQAVVRRQTPVAGSNFGGSALYLDSTPITWSGSPTPTFNTIGLFTSDPIVVDVDDQHDYWILIFFSLSTTGNTWALDVSTTGVTNNFLAGYDASGNVCAAPSPSTLNTQRRLIGVQKVFIG